MIKMAVVILLLVIMIFSLIKLMASFLEDDSQDMHLS